MLAELQSQLTALENKRATLQGLKKRITQIENYQTVSGASYINSLNRDSANYQEYQRFLAEFQSQGGDMAISTMIAQENSLSQQIALESQKLNINQRQTEKPAILATDTIIQKSQSNIGALLVLGALGLIVVGIK